jgi:hypothetical protein
MATAGLAFLSTRVAGLSPDFSPNQELPLPLTTGNLPVSFIVRGLEPSVRVDQQGTVYVTSIRGVPGGVDLHRYFAPLDGAPNPDGSYPFKYEGRPDGCGIFASPCNAVGIAEGGGDVDIAVNYPSTGVPNLALTSLTLAPGVTATHSADRGDTFTNPNPVAALIPGDDRQWMDATGAKVVYVSYHDATTFNIEVQRSNDGGATYTDALGEAIDPQTFPVAGGLPPTNTANIAGSIRVDRSPCPSRGNLYQIFVAPDTAAENVTGQPFRSVYVGVSSDVKLGLPVFTFTDYKIFTGPVGSSNENIFPALGVDGFGNLYAVWSDNSNVSYSFSTDLGRTWAPAIHVNTAETVGRPNVFPWIDADANGHVVITWFAGDRAGNSNNPAIHEPCAANSTDCMKGWTNWQTYLVESFNGHDPAPAFVQHVVSDHVIHRGTVSTGGLGGQANRNLGDYFQVALDPQHRANVAFSDDHKVHPLGPNNGPDNPTTRRLIRVNFTHALNRPAVATDLTCAGAGLRPPEADEDTGDGRDADDNRFDFVDRHDPDTGADNGALVYTSLRDGLSIRSANGVRWISYSGPCVTFSGDAKVNGRIGYGFTVTGCDLANPGAGVDTFSIDVTGPSLSYHKAGVISAGDIRLHR